MRRTILAALLAACAGPALAQGNPSAAEITRGLAPREDDVDRGIHRAGPDQPPPAPMARPAPTRLAAPQSAPAVPASPPTVNLSVLFHTGSAELTPEARLTLDELGKALSGPALSPYRFRIEGHTDTVGDPGANLALSGRRAAAVVAYLTARFGVDRARLQAAGLGDGMLLVPTGPGVAEPRNRRVQVVNIGR